MSASRIVLVEDHRLLSESVGIALTAEGWDVTIADLTDRDAALGSIAADEQTLVLLDLELGDPIGDSTSLIPTLVGSGATVLVVTGVRDRLRLAATVAAGAIGFVPKDVSYDVLLGAARDAAQGRSPLEANERMQLLAELRAHRTTQRDIEAPFTALTPRERAVLAALSAGKCVDTIAHDWVVSPATVRTQVRGVLTKLDVNSQLAAVAKARSAGWVQ